MPFRHLALRRRPFVLAALALLLGLAALPGAARAACPAQPEAGNWVNVASGSVAFPRIQLRFVCDGDPEWFVRVFGTCERRSCDWGEVDGQRLASGQIHALHRRGAAQHHIYAKMANGPDQLQVFVWTSYTDGRPDRETTALYEKD
jgi:hypothetical protein